MNRENETVQEACPTLSSFYVLVLVIALLVQAARIICRPDPPNAIDL